jgi:[ribosomal protein S5]-alanine N-acetyltransferase
MTDEPTITDVIHFLPTPFTLADAPHLIEGEGDGCDCFWCIWRRESSALIGTVDTHLKEVDEIEIGYWLTSSACGHGFGTEAVAPVVRTPG